MARRLPFGYTSTINFWITQQTKRALDELAKRWRGTMSRYELVNKAIQEYAKRARENKLGPKGEL